MAKAQAPLDEVVHAHPGMIEWWVSMGGQPMDENMVYRYVSESPFFVWESKNGGVFTQAKANVSQWQMSCDRKALEDYLCSRSGLEFLIVGEPQPVGDKALAAQGAKTGIWTIRKQNRESRLVAHNPSLQPDDPSVLIEKNPQDRSQYWEITVLATYFIVGENMFQAPSVFDIIGNRLLSATASLNSYFDTVAALPRYTPAAGHHYLPPRALKQTTSASSTATPNGGTPVPGSREPSVAPDGGDARTTRSGSVDVDGRQTTNGQNTSNDRENLLLANSLNLVNNYGDEFADENPLVGEPGNLRFTTSTAAVKKRRADEEAAEAKARAAKESAPASRVPSPKPEKAAPTPPAVFSETKVAKAEKLSKEERRGSKLEKKRKKSRANNGGTATSPTTPASATSTQAPNSALS